MDRIWCFLCFCVCHPDDDLVEVETCGREMSDKWLFIIYCAVCRIKFCIITVARNVGYDTFWSVLLDVDSCYANEMPFTLQTPAVSLCATRFNIKKFYVLFAPYIYIIFFFMDLSTNGGYWLTGLLWLYKRDGVCLLRGTDWIFKRAAP